ncbi:MAG: G8 domain-containing protein, partial [Pseudomonadota bacterium]
MITQDLKGGGSVTLQQAINSQVSDAHAAAHMAHMNGDDGMVSDHANLLNLFPDASDPDVAVALNGGSWFDASTWSTGKVPVDGQSVYIPAGVSVVYDDVSNQRLDKVAVDGELHFAVATDTKMVVDTLLTGPSSVLTIGTENNPVQNNVTAEILIHRDNGPINVAEDPSQLSKGVVTHGAVSIAGQDKDDYVNVSDYPEKGDTFLTFSERPDGWKVGDKLVVAGTKFVGENEFQDEVVTIKSIVNLGNGNFRVNLNETLQYDHIPPDNSVGVEFNVPVANYTRNVQIGTEINDSDYTDDGKTVPIDERGHVMFMHNPNVSVQNAEFIELGRTDKSQLLDDDDNVAGRYAVHFHRTGGEVG